MKARILIALLITTNSMFVLSSPFRSQTDDSDNRTDDSNSEMCIFGFKFNPIDGTCLLTLSIAGKVDIDSTQLYIVCPDGYTYTGIGKLCEKRVINGPSRKVIDAPIICKSGAQPDSNGKCRDLW